MAVHCFHFIYFCVCILEYKHHDICRRFFLYRLCRDQGSAEGFSSCRLCRDQTEVIRLEGKHLYPWTPVTGLFFVWLNEVLLCSPGCPGTGHPSALVSQVQGQQIFAGPKEKGPALFCLQGTSARLAPSPCHDLVYAQPTQA